MTSKPELQKIFRGILLRKMKINMAMKGWKLLNIKRRADK
jgi:hypothetical protein